jgi:tetratricopeptide (TPR) repeat protein
VGGLLKLIILLLAAALVISLLGDQHPAGTIFAVSAVLIAVAWVFALGDKAMTRAVHRSLAKGDYDAAIARSTAILRWFPRSAHFTFMRGTAYLFSGRLDEAEPELRAALDKGAGPAQSSRLVNLAYIQMDQGYFRHALATFEKAAKIYDASGTAYAGMAEARLRGGLETDLALDLLDRAIQLRTASPRWVKIDRHTLAYMYANRAWALALKGRIQEAEADTRRALEQADPAFVPGYAGTEWRVANALLAMGRPDEANAHLRIAAGIDPKGTYGRRCSDAYSKS